MYHRLKILFLAILTSVTISGCGVSESIRYEHKPSQDFYEDFNFDEYSAKYFKDKGVLFAVSIRGYSYDKYIIWLSFYTKNKNEKIFIKDAKIVGNNLEKNIEFNEELKINSITERDSKVYSVYNTDIKLIDIDEDELVKFFDRNDEMRISVRYIIENVVREKVFIINRKIDKEVNLPT